MNGSLADVLDMTNPRESDPAKDPQRRDALMLRLLKMPPQPRPKRADELLRGAKGKRLLYRQPDETAHA